MTRLGSSGERIEIKPTNNVYTVLAAIASIAAILGLVVLITRAKEIIPPGLF